MTTSEVILQEAVNNGDLDTAKKLVRQGADVNADDDQAIRIAASNGDLKMVKFLINNDADEYAALLVAAEAKKLDIVLYLVSERELDPDEYDHGAIKTAAAHGDIDMIKLLLDYGGDAIAALDAANLGGQLEAIKEILEYVPDIDEVLDEAMDSGQDNIVKVIKQFKAITERDSIASDIAEVATASSKTTFKI